MKGAPVLLAEGEPWKPRWELVVPLACGVLGWELAVLGLLSGGDPPPARAVAALLVKDAALLLGGWVLAVAGVRAYRRRETRPLTSAHKAGLLATAFLLVLLPVAVGRGLVQRQLATPEALDPGAARSATPSALQDDSRFLCSVANADAGAEDAPADTWGDTVWTALRDALLLQVPVFPLAWLLVHRRVRTALTSARGSAFTSLVWLGTLCLWRASARPAPEAPACPPGIPVRAYAVSAVAADLVLNAEGDHVPQGVRYVLDGAGAGSPGEPLHPLVLRANLGECLRLRFTNRLARESAALHLEGLGGTVGGPARPRAFVPGASLSPGQSLTYVLALPREPEAQGAYLLHDPEEGGDREARGLFGALVLEPAGTRYRDATTGAPHASGEGWEALIEPPGAPAFREWVLIAHAMGPPEVADVRSARGEPLPELDEMAGPFRAGAFGLNYHSHPQFERDEAGPGPRALPPLRSYRDESVTLRVVHAGNAEPHIPHVHGWREAADEPMGQPHLLMPGGSLSLTAPGQRHPAGDYLVHCHVPNHTTGGERLTWRVIERPASAP